MQDSCNRRDHDLDGSSQPLYKRRRRNRLLPCGFLCSPQNRRERYSYGGWRSIPRLSSASILLTWFVTTGGDNRRQLNHSTHKGDGIVPRGEKPYRAERDRSCTRCWGSAWRQLPGGPVRLLPGDRLFQKTIIALRDVSMSSVIKPCPN